MKVLVNNQEIDIYDSSDLLPRVTKNYLNLEDPSVRTGDYVFNLVFPRTKKNQKILGFEGLEKNADNLSKKFKCKIIEQYYEIFSGSLRIEEIRPTEYQCFLIGDNVDFFTELKNKKLRDLRNFNNIYWTGIYSYNYSAYTDPEAITPGVAFGILNIWDPNYLEGDINVDFNIPTEFCVPTVSYGHFPVPSKKTFSSTIPFVNENDLTFYSTVDDPLSVLDFPIAPFQQTTVRKIFEAGGYKVEGPYFTKEYYKNVFSPYVGEKDPEWNYSLLARIKYHYTNEENDNFIIGFTNVFGVKPFRSTTNNANIRYFNYPNTGYCCGGKGYNAYHDTDIAKSIFYIKPILCPKTTQANSIDSTFVTTSKKIDYLFDTIFYKSTDPDAASNNYLVNTYVAPADLRVYFKWKLGGFGARNPQWASPMSNPNYTSDPNLLLRQFFNNPIFLYNYNGTDVYTNFGFFVLVVKRKDNSFLGELGQGLVNLNTTRNFYAGGPNIPYVFDPQVVYWQYYNTQNSYKYDTYDTVGVPVPNLNNLDVSTIDLVVDLQTYDKAIELKKGESLEVVLAFTTFVPDEQFFSLDDSATHEFKVTPLGDPLLYPAKFLPDITQYQYLKDVITSYNLFLRYDEKTKTFFVSDFDNYFLPNSISEDWRDKVNIQNATYEPLYKYKQFRFTTAEDEKDFLSLNEFTNERELVVPINPNYTEEKLFSVSFSLTSEKDFYLVDYLTGDKLTTSVKLPTLSTEEVWKKSGKELYEGSFSTYDFKYRNLKYLGTKVVTSALNAVINVGDIFLEKFSNPGFFYSESTQFSQYWNSSFKGGPNPYYNLFNQHYSNQFNTFKNKYLISIDVLLKPVYFNSFDSRKYVNINDDLYIVSAIEELNLTEGGLSIVKLVKK